MFHVTDEELKNRVTFFATELEGIISLCETQSDIIVLATIMMDYARKGLGIGAMSQDLADAMIFDYLDVLSPATPRKLV
jgi:hypothetical protein